MPRKDSDSYWFKFHPDKYLGGTAGFSLEMHGAYLMLLLHQWESGVVLEDTAKSICGEVWNRIKHKFVPTELGYVNVRMDEERKHKQKISQKRTQAVMVRYKTLKNKKVKSRYKCTTNVVQPVSVSVYDSSLSFNNKSFKEKDKEKDKESSKEHTWRNDFEIYKKMVSDAFMEIIRDPAEMEKQQEYFSNLNIKKCLERIIENFWGEKTGWKHKIRTTEKGAEINMRKTLLNNIEKGNVKLPRKPRGGIVG